MATTSTDRRFAVLSSSAIKAPCKAATTANITLSGEQTIDGVSCVTDDRVLVKDQTDASENGIYICDSSGWERAPDWDGTYDIRKGTLIFVHSGTQNGWWYVTSADPLTIGTSNVAIANTSSALAVLSAFAQTVVDDADGDAMIETIIDNMTALTAPAIGDLLALSDISSNDGRKITLANLFKVIAGLTALTTPDGANDLILIYDADTGEAKVISPNNLLAAITTVVTMTGKSLWTAEGANVASASDCNIWSAADGNTVHVTGTTTITDWGTAPQAGAGMWVIFDGALQLTYNATTNKLNTGGANYTTAAGDRAFVYADSTSSYVVTIFPLTGAPLAIGTNQVVTASITDANVTQAKLANSSVGQAQLKTSLQQSTGTGGASPTTLALTGGLYSLAYFWSSASGTGTRYMHGIATSGYTTSVSYDGGDGLTYYLQCYYITASPPYDLGDGDIPLFIYAEVTPGGQVVRVDVAQDPPWIYNGPNRLNPYNLRYSSDGRVYMRQRAILAEHGSVARAVAAGLPMQTVLARLRTDVIQEVEITLARKNLDMPVVPHPFMNVTPGNTVIMLDPVSPVVQQLSDLHELNDPDTTVGKLIMDGRITIGNVALPRSAPPGVMPVQVRWRVTP